MWEGARGARDLLPTEVDAVGVVGWGAVDLIKALPEALGCGADLIGLIPNDKRLFQQAEDRGLTRADHG